MPIALASHTILVTWPLLNPTQFSLSPLTTPHHHPTLKIVKLFYSLGTSPCMSTIMQLEKRASIKIFPVVVQDWIQGSWEKVL